MKHFVHTPVNIFIVCHGADFKVDFKKKNIFKHVQQTLF